MNERDIKKELERSEHFNDLTFSQSSIEKLTKKIYFQKIISDILIGLVTLFLFFVYIVTIHNVIIARYIPEFIRFFILIAMIILFFVLAKKVGKWVQKLRFSFIAQLFIIGLLLLYYIYQAFAPYFYSDDYLIDHGIEKIKLSYQVDDVGLTQEERKETAYNTYIRLMAFANTIIWESQDSNLADTTLIDYHVLEIHRSFNRYVLIVETTDEIDTQIFTGKRKFTFEKEKGEFKLSGKE